MLSYILSGDPNTEHAPALLGVRLYATMNTSVNIRPARAADKDAVLAFTKQTWEWGDYIEDVWDHWLNTTSGELAVAEAGRNVVGMTMTTILSTSEGWMQGLRVHPDYRRHGLARALTLHQFDYLRQHAVPVVRLAVHCRNLASQTHVARSGFRRMTTFADLEQREKDIVSTDAVAETLTPTDVGAAWPQIEQSPTLRAAAGLWANGWTWQRLTREIFAGQASQGHVLGVRDAGYWGALAIAMPDGDGKHIGYVDGAGPALEHLARALTGQAQRTGAKYNVAMLPPDPSIVSTFRQAGYAGDSEGAAMYIYELSL